VIFIPNTPQHDDGIRIDPPPSLACAIGTMPEATAAAAPPLDPPGVSSTFHGFRVGPNSLGSVTGTRPNSGVFDVPTTIRPAASLRLTISVEKVAMLSLKNSDPNVSRTPLFGVRSLIK